MIEAIIFDVGGVYMQGSFIEFMNKSYKILGIPGEFKTDSIVTFDDDYNKGLINAEECFRKVFGVEISEENMNAIFGLWTNTWKPETQMLSYVKALQRKYVTAVLSNSDPVNSEKYTKEGWYDPFDYLVLSHEVQINKPDPEIYKIILDKVGVPASECVFIDDIQENLDVASKTFGMKTILYQSFEQMIRELMLLGVRVD